MPETALVLSLSIGCPLSAPGYFKDCAIPRFEIALGCRLGLGLELNRVLHQRFR